MKIKFNFFNENNPICITDKTSLKIDFKGGIYDNDKHKELNYIDGNEKNKQFKKFKCDIHILNVNEHVGKKVEAKYIPAIINRNHFNFIEYEDENGNLLYEPVRTGVVIHDAIIELNRYYSISKERAIINKDIINGLQNKLGWYLDVNIYDLKNDFTFLGTKGYNMKRYFEYDVC